MDINILEELIENKKDSTFYPIIGLIINAVREYPLYELKETDLFFIEVKKIINSDEITYGLLKKYILQNPNHGNENNIWIISSLHSLLEAFYLMDIQNISLEEIQNFIKEIT
ncbi:MAG: hypothetical protein CFE21_10540 [Bacteroidetes bacterium B1(2017)]|nr:MAG: hypothetical protein CFE21_10540 [Bacteroidetes bacterium B1(2017)]